MFYDATSFNKDISNWNVSKVTNMNNMFYGASVFNQDIGAWNVSSVTNMDYMFNGALAFNQDISTWNVSSVTNMDYMFYYASSFNQDISTWCVTNIVSEPIDFSAESPLSENNKPVWGTCPYVFTDANIHAAVDLWVSDVSTATTTYGNISNWNVSQVTDMSALFRDKTTFNDDISNWDVSSVTNMDIMFYLSSFNQDISSWDVSNVTNMGGMFRSATSFNQDIGSWDVSSVTYMDSMLFNTSFNQDISTWCVTNIVSEPTYFSSYSPLSVSNKPIWGTCPTLGIDDQNLINISIYPNPTNNTLFISGSETPIAVSIYNVLGKEVLSVKNTNSINVQALPSGVYVIRISDGVGQTNRKFIKN